METPVPFVLTGEDGTGLVIDPQAKAALSKIDKPLVVVSVVGMYRTGKSFLLNRLMNRTDGFPLGSTIEAKTKGIWMWVGDFPSDPSKALVLLDTEGLHDPEKSSKTHDARIFTLSVLLSSILVYNTKGAIDASSLEGLQLATELTSHISMKAGDEEEMGEDFAKFFPVLVWAVRDHHLKLSVDGKEISSNDYLENCLTMKKARKKEDHDTNFLRETIRDFFKERQCFVFPLPTSMDKLENLEQMQLSELDPEFVTAGNKFAEFVIQRSPSKMVRGKAITGMMYATLAEQYVEAIVAGNVNIESAYESMIFMENSKSKAAALEFYKAEMNGLQLPLEMDALNAANAKAHETATGIFLKTAVNSHRNNNYFEEMTAELSAIFEDVTEKNLTVSNEVSYKILEDLYAPIDSRVGAGEFTRAGGHQAYKKEVEKMAEDYKKLPNNQKGPCGDAALVFFQREKIDSQLGSLLQTDKALSEEERRAEQLRREVEIEKQENALLEKKSEEQQKYQEEMRKTYEANLMRSNQKTGAVQPSQPSLGSGGSSGVGIAGSGRDLVQPGSGACAEEATRPHLVYSENKMVAVRMMSQEGPNCPGPNCPGPNCQGPNLPRTAQKESRGAGASAPSTSQRRSPPTTVGFNGPGSRANSSDSWPGGPNTSGPNQMGPGGPMGPSGPGGPGPRGQGPGHRMMGPGGPMGPDGPMGMDPRMMGPGGRMDPRMMYPECDAKVL